MKISSGHYDDFIDLNLLSDEDLREIISNPEDPRHYKNIYDPNDYDSLVETYEKSMEGYTDLWGDFVPTDYQLDLYKFLNQKDEQGRLLKHLEANLVWHRRAGKSVGSILCCFLPYMATKPNQLFLHLFPSLTQARMAIWNGMGKISNNPDAQAVKYLSLFPKQLIKKINNHSMTIEFHNGSIYQLVGVRGADGTADHLRGINPYGIVGDEFAEWNDDIFTTIFSPILAQNGGWAVKVYTPKGENHAFQDHMFIKQQMEQGKKNFFAQLLTIEDTFYPSGEPVVPKSYVDMLRKRGEDQEKIDQEFYCSFKASSSGAWYRFQMTAVDEDKRIVKLNRDPDYPVIAAYDLGGASKHQDFTVAGIFQVISNKEIRLIDCIYFQNVPTGDVLDRVNAKYNIIRHYLPFDGNTNKDSGTTYASRVDNLKKKKGITNITVVDYSFVLYGIEKVKEIFPFLWFDQDNCQMLLMDLRNYKKRKNNQTGMYVDEPVHDKHSHGADMLRTFALAWATNKIEIPSSGRRFALSQNFNIFKKKKEASLSSSFNITPL